MLPAPGLALGVSILGAPNERRGCRRLSRKAGQPSHPPTGVDGAPKSPFGCSVFKDRGPWHFCGTEKRYPLPHHILLKIGFWAGEWGSSSGSPAPPVALFGPSGGWAQIPSPAPPCTARTSCPPESGRSVSLPSRPRPQWMDAFSVLMSSSC